MYFLCRPGEYNRATMTGALSGQVRLCDVEFHSATRRHSAINVPLRELESTTAAALTFTNQKHGVCNEWIIHGRSRGPNVCPVYSLLRRVQHLRLHHASLTTPQHTVFHSEHVPSTAIVFIFGNRFLVKYIWKYSKTILFQISEHRTVTFVLLCIVGQLLVKVWFFCCFSNITHNVF